MVCFSEHETRDMIQRYREGWGINRLAEHCGRSAQVVRRHLVENGAHIRSHGRPRRKPDDVLVEVYRRSKSVRAAAVESGYSDAGLAYRLEQANEIPPRRAEGGSQTVNNILDKAVAKGAAEECWPATGTAGTGGYVQLKVGRRNEYAHRLAWKLHYGREIPPGFLVTHDCDNPECANPHHLRLGTPRENTRQMLKRNRSGRAKLRVEDVHEIRGRARAGESLDDIAPDYPVGRLQVDRIIKNKCWRDL